MVLITVSFFCCAQTKKIRSDQSAAVPGPPTIVYKTKADYFNNVPVLLSTDKQTIVAYPDPKDLTIDNKFCQPTKLKQGYLLDNRGISLNVGFLNISYLEYSRLATPPSINELKKLILDTDPLIELYDLELRYNFKNMKKEINQIITRNQLTNYKRLK
jgi:hypothetical protein